MRPPTDSAYKSANGSRKIGDPRPGVGVKNGKPDIAWLPVTLGGKVKITRVWLPETPDDVARVLSTQYFNVEPFYIAKYLVTNAQYQAFVEADDGFENLDWWQGMPDAYQPQKLAEPRIKLLNNPRDSISWYQCVAFARWMNHRLQGYGLPHPSGKGVLQVGDNAQIRLPAEWEWQWAAQNGAAACGALDMAGNLMEWCANDKVNLDIVDVESTASKVHRGGDWGYGIEIASCANCDDDDPARIDVLNGFRLVLGTNYKGELK